MLKTLVTILILGDSLSAFTLDTDSAPTWAARLPGLLGPRYAVENVSVGGTGSPAWDPETGTHYLSRVIPRGHRDLVIVQLGTNDPLLLRSAEKYRETMERLVSALVLRGSRVLVIPPPPAFDERRPPALLDAYVVALESGVCRWHQVRCTRRWPLDPDDTVDGVHPTPELSTRLALEMARIVRAISRSNSR